VNSGVAEGHQATLDRTNIPDPIGSQLHSVRIRVQSPDMESIAASVRSMLDSLSDRAFVHARRVPGPTGAVEAELSRLVRRGEIRRARKGLYWKGPKTRLGIAAPAPQDVALAVAGLGAGPSGIEAARWLGLTTQVPGRPQIAVPGRVPAPIAGVRFCSRSTRRREVDLAPLEVAVIEVLRDWPMSVEVGWDELRDKISELAATLQIRVDRIGDQVADEHHIALRDRWAELGPMITLALAKRP
jgi:hypothetical protein